MRIIALVALVVGFSVPSVAQNRVPVSEKIVQLEKQIRALQRRVFQGGDLPPSSNAAPAPSASNNDRALMADVQVQISSLETQLRNLTGQIEELQYQQRQNADAIERLQNQFLAGRPLGAQNTAQPTGQSTTPSSVQTLSDGVTQAESLSAPTVAAPARIELPAGSPNERYQYAFSFVHKNELDNARIALEQFIAAHAGDPLLGNAKYWLGRVHMQQERPGQAANELFGLITEYPNHDKKLDALVDLATVLIQLDAREDACASLREFESGADGASPRLRQRAAQVANRAQCS